MHWAIVTMHWAIVSRIWAYIAIGVYKAYELRVVVDAGWAGRVPHNAQGFGVPCPGAGQMHLTMLGFTGME